MIKGPMSRLWTLKYEWRRAIDPFQNTMVDSIRTFEHQLSTNHGVAVSLHVEEACEWRIAPT